MGVLYNGINDKQHHEEVAIIIEEGLEKSIIEWKPINCRRVKIRMREKRINSAISQCCAAMNDSEKENNDSF